MQKRGQLYILSALLIAFALFIIISPTNIVKRTVTETNFYDIAENFDKESARFLNYLLDTNSAHLGTDFLNFTVLFSSYAKTKNPDVGVVFTFVKDDTLYLGNYDKANATFSIDGDPAVYTISGCFADIDAAFSVAGFDIALSSVPLSTYSDCMKEVPLTLPPPYILHLLIKEPDSTTNLKTSLEPNHPDLIIVARESSGTIKKIFLKGEFITP